MLVMKTAYWYLNPLSPLYFTLLNLITNITNITNPLFFCVFSRLFFEEKSIH